VGAASWHAQEAEQFAQEAIWHAQDAGVAMMDVPSDGQLRFPKGVFCTLPQASVLYSCQNQLVQVICPFLRQPN